LREAFEVDRLPVDARRRAGLEPADRKAQVAQPRREPRGRRIACAPAGIIRFADVDLAAEERADRQHDDLRADHEPHLRHDAADAAVLDHEIVDALLEQRETRLALEHATDRLLVEHAIGLRAGRTHRGTLAGVQHLEMNPGGIGRDGHRAAERVDLLREMRLADPADRRVAAHLAEGLDVLRDEQRLDAHARGRKRRLGAGMAAADDDAAETVGVLEYSRDRHARDSSSVNSASPGTAPRAPGVPCRQAPLASRRRSGHHSPMLTALLRRLSTAAAWTGALAALLAAPTASHAERVGG